MEQTDERVAASIRGCVSIGSGSLTNFYLDGKLVKEEVKWKKWCIIDELYGGLLCDGEMIVHVPLGHKWYAETMINKGIVINSCDASKIADIEDVERKATKKHKVVNI